MYQIRNSGWIEVITGSMYCGKSEELIRRIRRAHIARQRVQVFKPALDDRYAVESITSHDGSQIHAISIQEAGDVLLNLHSDTAVVGIDEVQFIDEEVIDVCEQLADNGIRVIVAGLDRDFRGEPFGPMPGLLARAEYIEKLHAICVRCGNPASRTQRLVNGSPAQYTDPIIMVGAQEAYEARCRRCHEVAGSRQAHGSYS